MIKAAFAALAVTLYLVLAWGIAEGRVELGGTTPNEPLRFWVSNYFFASAGAVLFARAMAWLMENVRGRLTVFVWIAVFGTSGLASFVNMCVGGSILFDHDAPILGWALLSAGLAGLISTWPRAREERDPVQELVDQVYPAQPPATAAESRPDPRRSLRDAIETGMWTTVAIAAALAPMVIGVRVFNALIEILITGEITTPDEAVRALTFLNEPMLLMLIAFPFVGFVAYFIMGLGRAVWETALLTGNSGAAKDLPQAAIDEIETRAKAIETYIRQAPHIHSATFGLIDIVLFVGGPFGALFVLFWGVPEAINLMFAARLDPQDFRIVGLSHTIVPVSLMPGIGILGFAVGYVAGGFWRAYGEHAAVQVYSNEDYGITLRGRLARLARSGTLIKVPRDPGLALRYLHTTLIQYILWPGAVMTAIGAAASAAILSDVRIATPQGVEVANAWSQMRTLRPYTQAKRLVLSCWLNKVGDPKPGARLELRDGKLPLFDTIASLNDRAIALEALDRALRVENVPVEWESGEYPFSAECVDTLTEGLDSAEADRIRTIFRVDDWRGRQ